jgi:2-haloalkanoic acid dehalogenase type II
VERWATLDCYGTLIDWNGGVRAELEHLWPYADSGALLARYHELEPQVQAARPGLGYHEVLAQTLERIAQDAELPLDPADRDALGASLPSWRAFPEVRAALEDARARGWRLAILSNTDRDFIEASKRTIGVPFELDIVAGEIGSYKPAPRHWEQFFAQTGAPKSGHVHVGASLFHDVAPATRLGLRSVWINRLGERPEPPPTRELPDLAGLPDTLDELVRV